MKNPFKKQPQHEVSIRAYTTWAILYKYAYEAGIMN